MSAAQPAPETWQSPPFVAQTPSGSDTILDAAARCIDRKGFDSVSLEEVAVEAGVSRTTLYRRYGNRESLFKALLITRAEPFRLWSRRIYLGPGTVMERIETVLTEAILEMQRVGWLDRSLLTGMSAAAIRLFKASHAHGADLGLAPLLSSTMNQRAAAEACVTVAELIDWTADQMIVLASAAPWSEETLRGRLRYFVMPVLVPAESCGPDAGDRLAGIERRLDMLIERSEEGRQ
ncbi:TetR/AcrR family transcriptional regulator (plasmid) [Sphingomonas paeninsulae]|uniref:TetR/AcrR family transcriptional regulator n=1 Tax=Sphingomonas paeninsulae TaxID=2319844 RepID=A0A494TDR4_SPHPE|nr:TetR/AcrR family transcriptional regulator [Sphingomonas paeninsulae]AYJ85412.1 TetR/AcrR family transcriptional regulator [Sphingomonas paeninsulae]